MANWDKKLYRPKRTRRDRALAQLRGYWEPQDVSEFEHTAGEAVSKAMGDLGLNSRFNEEQVFEAWNELVSDFVATNSRPVALQRKVLSIQVLHSTVHYELERMKGQILQKMQDQFGAENIREVRFRLG
ncbi:MAG: DUF721 domain-containing protein [Verrucomicrobiales bacterium]|nr:DUF721 domain-containing protein [Verrucomicrobiales bacterium]